MGKILNGILGGVSGKVAGVVGGSWKGINYLRGYAIPANPQTAPQVAQRNRLTWLVSVARSVLTSILQPFWDPFQTAMSGYNRFMQKNLQLISAPDDYDLIAISEGNLESTTLLNATYNSGTGEVVMTWSEAILGNGELTDTAVQVILDDANDVAFVDTEDTRDTETSSWNVGAGRTAANLHAYLFFTRGTGEDLEVSDSDYHIVSAPE